MSIFLSTLFPLTLALPGAGLAAPVAPPGPSLATVSAARDNGRLYLAQSPSPTAAPASAAIDTAAVIDRAAQAMTAVRTAEGKFTQIDDSGRQSAGIFYISRPGKVRFDYVTPEPMHIVSDGVSVSVEEPKRASYDAAPLASTPLHLFLRSNVDLKRDGSVVDVRAKDGAYLVTLEDKSGEAQGRMTLEFRASDFALLGWTTTDGTGAQTRVKLADTQTNIPLKASLFIVKDPADARDDRR